MEEEMEVVDDLIDLTNESIGDLQNGFQAVNDEDFAKRLQMEEYETLRASDYLVAQQLQDEFQMEDLGHHNFDSAPLRFNHGDLSRPSRRIQPTWRRPVSARPPPEDATSDETDGDGGVPGSLNSALRLFRVQQAMARNRTPQEAEGSSHSSNPVAPSNADASEHDALDRDVPPPVPRRPVRFHVRRRAEHAVTPEVRQRTRVLNGHRVHMIRFPTHGRDPYLQLFDFDDGSGNNYDALWELSERIGDAGSKGLSKTEINRLPTIKYRAPESTVTSWCDAATSEASTSSVASGVDAAASDDCTAVEGRDCRICLSEFSNEELLRTLPCCHRFHIECIDQWIMRNAICPVCRDDIKGHVRRHRDDWGYDGDLMS